MRLIMTLIVGLMLSTSLVDYGFATEEDDLAEMQRKMNQEVMDKPFLAEEPEKVEAYIKDAMKKDLKPTEYTGTHWRSGYTCHDLLRWSWYEYRNCSYYHRYHGRYYY